MVHPVPSALRNEESEEPTEACGDVYRGGTPPRHSYFTHISPTHMTGDTYQLAVYARLLAYGEECGDKCSNGEEDRAQHKELIAYIYRRGTDASRVGMSTL